MKAEIKKEKIEIVRQVKLTTGQRVALVTLANAGGRGSVESFNARQDLLALGLIEHRLWCTAGDRSRIGAELRELWKTAAHCVKEKNAPELNRVSYAIQGKERELRSMAYWLTPAANEYLTKGKVTVVR